MILVTGGTGLVGSHLLYALTQQHDTVRAIHRTDSNLELVKEVFSFYTSDVDSSFQKIEWVEANIIEIPALTIAFEGVTEVYHCAAFINFDSRKYYQLKKTNVEGTANVVNLCLSQAVRKICHVSSIATLGATLDGSPISEDDDWNPEAKNTVYAITKFGAEMEVWRGVQEGLDAVIVNPGVILGEGHFHKGSSAIVRKVSKGIRYYTSGSTGFVDVRDVVQGMIALMESEIANERFTFVGDTMSFKRMLTLFSENFRRKPPSKLIRKSTLLFLSNLDAIAYRLFGRKRKLPKPMIESLYNEVLYDTSKLLGALDFKFTPIESTIERVSNAYSSSSSNTGSTN